MNRLPLAVFITLGTWLAIVDIQQFRLPNKLTGTLALALLATWPIGLSDWAHLQSAAAFSGILLALHLYGNNVLNRNTLGLGDVKFGWSCGWVIANPANVVWALWLAFAAASLLNFSAIRRHSTHRIAFGPYLLVASCLTSISIR